MYSSVATVSPSKTPSRANPASGSLPGASQPCLAQDRKVQTHHLQYNDRHAGRVHTWGQQLRREAQSAARSPRPQAGFQGGRGSPSRPPVHGAAPDVRAVPSCRSGEDGAACQAPCRASAGCCRRRASTRVHVCGANLRKEVRYDASLARGQSTGLARAAGDAPRPWQHLRPRARIHRGPPPARPIARPPRRAPRPRRPH